MTLNAVKHFFHRTLWLLTMYHQTKSGCQEINGSDNIVERVIFWLNMSLLCDFDLGNKMFCDSDNIIQTNIHWHFEPSLWPWPWMQLSHFSTMLYYQTKFGCKETNTFGDTTEIVIFWLYRPLLWPWHWTQWNTFSAWHSGLWWCKTISGLATECSVVQKISSRQIFTDILNLCCDLDLERSNPIFPQDSPAYDAALSNKVWLQTDQLFRRYSKNSHILII